MPSTLILAVLFSILFYSFSFSQTSLIFSEDFESGEMTIHCSGNCPTVTTFPVRAGQYAMKTYLHSTESPVNYRTEISIPGNAVIGDHYWYGFSIYLPQDYAPDNIWEVVTQWHGVPDFDIGEDWRNPIMAVWTTNGKWSVHDIWDAKENTFESGERVYDGSTNWDLGAYETGKWVDWVFQKAVVKIK